MNNKTSQETWAAKVWVTKPDSSENPEQFIFPEQITGSVSNPKTGICFSGGGTRSLTACLGQLRALTTNGLLEHVGNISSVSGGSWAATAFTYNPSGTDQQLLGKVVQPGELTFEYLRNSDTNSMGTLGQTALNSGFSRAKALWERSFQSNLLWYEVVGEFFFAPFGLFDSVNDGKATKPKPQAYFSFDNATVSDIQNRNASLQNDKFFTVREASGSEVSPRPYLIVNAILLGPQGVSNQPDFYVGLELTPLYVGAPHIFEINYPTSTSGISETVYLGGGFLETFAFGTEAPTQLPEQCSVASTSDGSQSVSLISTTRHFNMVEASAMSSAFYAQAMAKYLNDTNYTMVRDVWPVSDTSIGSPPPPLPTYSDYFIGDGGLLENFGVISLLLRAVEKIVIFVNTSTQLDVHYIGTTPPHADQIDTVIPQLFGQVLANGSKPYPLDHVFSLEGGTDSQGQCFDGYAKVVQDLVAAKQRKTTDSDEWAGVVSLNRLMTVPNSNWGLPGGSTVEVLWVYLDRVQQWEDMLPSTADPNPIHSFDSPWTMKKYITYGNGGGSHNWFGRHYEPVPYFPNYSLAYENNSVEPDFQLNSFQINLMANLTWWVVDKNADKLKTWLMS